MVVTVKYYTNYIRKQANIKLLESSKILYLLKKQSKLSYA